VYCRSGAFTDFSFSITAAISILENKNAPRFSAFGAR
jgi:hypothetical protein